MPSIINDNIKEPGRVTPEARVLVYIKDKLAGDDTGKRILVELLGFRQVSTNLTMNGMGTATITVPNYKNAKMRFISSNTVKKAELPNTNKLYQTYFDNIINDTNGLYDKFWKYMVINRGDKPIGAEGLGNLRFDQWSRSRDGIINQNDTNPLKMVTTKEQILNEFMMNSDGTPGDGGDGILMYILPFVDLFDPIFVDYKGQDGFWYAGFTGFVTKVGDNFTLAGDQSITIQCKDATVLLDNVSVVSAWNRLASSERDTTLGFVADSEVNVSAGKSAYENYFAGKFKSIRKIIANLINVSQQMWQMPGTSDETGLKTVGFKIDPIFKYPGLSGRRGNALAGADNVIRESANDGTMDAVAEIINKPENFNKDFELTDNDYIYDRLVLMDYLLYDMDNMFIHKLLTNSLSLYKDSIKSADSILNDIVSRMYAYKYIDGNGNMIIELPKYNAMPNLEEYGGRSYATVMRHEAQIINSKSKIHQIVPIGTQTFYSQRDIPNSVEDFKWYTLNFHGINYIASSDDFISASTSIDEAALVTVATVQGTPPFLSGISSDLYNSSKYLQGTAAAEQSLLAKLGVRRYPVQNLVNVQWRNNEDGNKILSYLCATILERVNAQADSGTIQVSHRPDLQLGRTFINPLRWKSYLITGVSNSWSAGGRHTTTLSVSYGHPMHKTIDFPWSAILAEPDVFMKAEDLEKTNGIDPNGQVVTKNNTLEDVNTTTIADEVNA